MVTAGVLFLAGRDRVMARFVLRCLEALSLELRVFDLATFDLALAGLACFAVFIAGCAASPVALGMFAGGRRVPVVCGPAFFLA